MNAYSQSEGDPKSHRKPVILAFVGHYLPGDKSGGILRITINTIDHLCDYFEFKIVTRDRDLDDDQPYAGVRIRQWQRVGNAQVYYLAPAAQTVKEISDLIDSTPHDILYLNSFFDSLTIKALTGRKLHRFSQPAIVVPWGEFGWASLKQKYPKKWIFLRLARITGLYDNVVWRASSENEKQDIIKYMNVRPAAIEIVGDLPLKKVPDVQADTAEPTVADVDLRLVFLSRISPEKNLDYALRVLQEVKAQVIFDIYGPAENTIYWKECQALIEQLPPNVKVNYLGSVEANKVVQIFSQYDLFFFPTGGEAYGHVIAECLIAGTPVLLSTETPWRNLDADDMGWDIDLSQKESFRDLIEKMALSTDTERIRKRNIIKSKIMGKLLAPEVLAANVKLFKRLLPPG